MTDDAPDAVETLMCDLLSEKKELIDTLEEFLIWLKEEKGVRLGREPFSEKHDIYYTTHFDNRKLAGEFVGVDYEQLSRERDALLEALYKMRGDSHDA